jgi:periplasmic mercuric ion binding protein
VKAAVYIIVLAMCGLSCARAAERTVVLNIPTMDCATCPLTIKTALLKVKGVSRADVSYERREARVTFDDAVGTVAALKKAASDAGYPALLGE